MDSGARAGPGSRRVTMTDPPRNGLLLTRIICTEARSLLTDAARWSATAARSAAVTIGRAAGRLLSNMSQVCRAGMADCACTVATRVK